MLTKSIRLNALEAKELEDFVRDSGGVEAAILKRAALRGLREDRIDHGVLAYLGGETTQRAAAVANLPRARFLDLLAEKGITVLDHPSSIPDELDLIARLSNDRRLSGAAESIRSVRDADPAAAPTGRKRRH